MKTAIKREANIELLRILSMFFVLLLHAFQKGGLLSGTETFSLSYIAVWIVRSLALVAVNCYVMISGYFLVTKKFKGRSLVSLWLKTFFYSIVIFAVLALLGQVNVTPGSILNAGLPVIMKEYWFVTVYMALYLLFPFLNLIIHNLTQRQHKGLLIVSILIFCVWNTIFPISESFDIASGYSVAWFIILYLTAAYIRLHYEPKHNKYRCLLVYFIAGIIPGLSTIVLTLFDRVTGVGAKYAEYLHVYNSLPVFIASVALFLFFLRVRIKGRVAEKVILFVSPLTFGVYLIHEQLNLRYLLWTDYLHLDNLTNSPWLVPLVLLTCAGVFAAACIVDLLRTWLFRAVRRTHKNDISSKLTNKIDALYENITSSK